MRDDTARRPTSRPRVWLVVGGPLGLAVVRGIAHAAGFAMEPWQLAVAVAGAVALSLAGFAAIGSPRFAGAITGLGSAALVASLVPALRDRPALTLIALIFLIGMTSRIWTRTLGLDRIEHDTLVDLRLAALIALVTWLIAAVASREPDLYISTASAIASAVAITHALTWSFKLFPRRWWIVWATLIAVAVAMAATAASVQRFNAALSILALVPTATLFVARARGIDPIDTGWAALITDHPARLVITTFLLLCGFGTLLLSLPPVEAAGADISLLDAAFTAVSSVCVTGLIVLDTPHDFSAFGQLSLLILIQIGALGIMSLSTAALGLLGRRLSVKHERAVAGLFAGEHRGQLFVAIKRTIAVTLAVEAIGAIVLAGLFWHAGDALGDAVWRGAFTAVSAFCNAGFALQTDSLIGYQHAAAILHCVAILIVLGGLSPVVIVVLPAVWARRPVALQVKVVLVGSATFLVIGFVGYLALEWNHSLSGLSAVDRLHNAWFQSVTFRTAGFNSVDLADMRAATMPLACILMFIGGAPGGTAGGIKVTTAWVLVLAVAAAIRGRPRATAFKRQIPHGGVYKALAVTSIGAATVAFALLAILLTQTMAGDVALFEVVSATGTVGVSVGGTGQLDDVGKVIIMVAMFLGRVGPLTAFLFLAERDVRADRTLVEESVEVG